MQEKIVEYFDDQAAEYRGKYEKINDMRSFIFSERKRIVLSLLDNEISRLLDVGCGPGVFTDELSRKCGELFGMDISKEMIEIALANRRANCSFSVGKVEELAFGNDIFDACLCVGVLEYLDNVEAGIKEVARVTKDGGFAIFTVPNSSSILNRLDYWMRAVLKACRRLIKLDISRSFMNYDFKPRLFSGKYIASLLGKYGFEVEQDKYHIFRISFLNRLDPALSLSLARKFNNVSSRFIAINHIVKARKVNEPSRNS